MFRNFILRTLMALLLWFFSSQLTESRTLYGAEFFCPSGDVTCLIAAINKANSTPEEDTINLEPGTYALVAGIATGDGATGLPSVTSHITINGAGADATIIERDLNLPIPRPPDFGFRILHVSTGGNLSLNRLTIRGGIARTLFLNTAVVSQTAGFARSRIENGGSRIAIFHSLSSIRNITVSVFQ